MLRSSSLRILANVSQRQHAGRLSRSSHVLRSLASTSSSTEDNAHSIHILPLLMMTTMMLGTAVSRCESISIENLDSKEAPELGLEKLPEYTSQQVAEHNGQDGKRVWMTYGGIVYDVTDFIPNHPGGSEKISEASGNAIEPFWHLYRQHYASDLPTRLMEHMVVGRLAEKDQEAIDEQMEALMENDPYAREPVRHKALHVHSDTPMNAETPARLLTESYLTPPSLFYIRHHHPVPFLSQREVQNYKLKIDLTAYGKGILELNVDDLKQMPKTEVVATLQCSGNRRGGFNDFKRTSGTSWGQGAISTAKWGGVKLSEVLKRAGVDDPIHAQESGGMEHIRFYSMDGMRASICIEKGMSPYGDCIVAYEMNDEPLPRDHGFPLRVIVPGYAAVRNVKWLSKIELAATEADGAWQRGLNYKTLPPNVTDAKTVNLDEMPSMTEVSLFSGITETKVASTPETKPGDLVSVKAAGWAWAGGGRNVVRVDLTGDDGDSWVPAKLTEGKDQRFGRAWAWVFWECENITAVVRPDGKVHLASKAVDMAFNVQPESSDHTWNVRGLGNNSWYKTTAAP